MVLVVLEFSIRVDAGVRRQEFKFIGIVLSYNNVKSIINVLTSGKISVWAAFAVVKIAV